MSNESWDLFISHAWEDKDEIARPLAKRLSAKGLNVWYDESVLTLGDSIRRSIDIGLTKSRFGLVILSPSFFAKEWPQKELDALVSKDHGEKVILPVWHNVSKREIAEHSPLLSDKLAVSTSEGLDHVVEQIVRALSRQLQGFQEYETVFSSLYLSHSRGPDEAKIDEGDFSPSLYNAFVRIDLGIVGLDKLPASADEKGLPVRDCVDLKAVARLARRLLICLGGVEERAIIFYRRKDSYSGRLGRGSLPTKNIMFDIDADPPKGKFANGYVLDIEDGDCVFTPWEENGNTLSEPALLFSKAEHAKVKGILLRLLKQLTGRENNRSPFVAVTETPKMGGFGYVLPYRTMDEFDLLEE